MLRKLLIINTYLKFLYGVFQAKKSWKELSQS